MQRNKFCVGDRIEIMKPDGRDIPIIVKSMYNQNGESVDSAPHPKEIIDLEVVNAADPSLAAEIETGDILRVVVADKAEAE